MVLLINVTPILNKKKQIVLLGIKSNSNLSVQLYFCPVHHILLQTLNFSLLLSCWCWVTCLLHVTPSTPRVSSSTLLLHAPFGKILLIVQVQVQMSPPLWSLPEGALPMLLTAALTTLHWHDCLLLRTIASLEPHRLHLSMSKSITEFSSLCITGLRYISVEWVNKRVKNFPVYFHVLFRNHGNPWNLLRIPDTPVLNSRYLPILIIDIILYDTMYSWVWSISCRVLSHLNLELERIRDKTVASRERGILGGKKLSEKAMESEIPEPT